MAGVSHIIGAGIAGLSAATALAAKGHKVIVYESSRHAGGRCRSFFERSVGCRIDNGNHLMLSGNTDVLTYLNRVGSQRSLTGPGAAVFPFVDLEDRRRWVVDISKGFFPWWIFSPQRRVPKSSPIDYLKTYKLRNAKATDSVGDVLDDGSAFFRSFWEPLTVSILNTPANEAAASLLWDVISQTLCKGAEYCRPLVARDSLSETFVDPALSYLEKNDVKVFYNARLREINFLEDRAAKLLFGSQQIELKSGDNVILSVPPKIASGLVPDLKTPSRFHSIVNAHFKLGEMPKKKGLFGVVGGTAHWLFTRNQIVSVTVSGADDLALKSSNSLAEMLWKDVTQVLELFNVSMPAHRVIKEKYATFSQTPEQILLRPKAKTQWENVILAGDWTSTGLPATIEGALRSGRLAAELIHV